MNWDVAFVLAMRMNRRAFDGRRFASKVPAILSSKTWRGMR